MKTLNIIKDKSDCQDCPRKLKHKEWRRIAKKERRRRLRRITSQKRQDEEEKLRAALERSAEYLKSLEEKEADEKAAEKHELEEHAAREKLWLEEERRAQEEWQILQEKKSLARQKQIEQAMKIRVEWEEKQELIRKKNEEQKRRQEEERRQQSELQQQINDYIDNGIKTPEPLREIIESQPGKEACPFFSKTGACRYGDNCSRNHRRVCLSNIILIPGFYTHFSLEKNAAEYDTDISLEYEVTEMREHYRQFYKDVVPELESFGKIRNIKCCCNTEIHLRGNLYVEYYFERDAARALRKLKGRWYAGRQLNCEFANLSSWRGAVCGMQKCPKGRACNFLHTLRNPHGKYDVKSPSKRQRETVANQNSFNSKRNNDRHKSKWEESILRTTDESRNWRWSESPEIELVAQCKTVENYHSDSYGHDRSKKCKKEDKRRKSSRHDEKYSSLNSSNRFKRKLSDNKHEYRNRSPGNSNDYKERTMHRKREENHCSQGSKLRAVKDKRSLKNVKDGSHSEKKKLQVDFSGNSAPKRNKMSDEITLPLELTIPDTESNNVHTNINTEGDKVKCKTLKSERSKWDDHEIRESSPESSSESVSSTDSNWSGSTDNSDASPVRRRKRSKVQTDEKC